MHENFFLSARKLWRNEDRSKPTYQVFLSHNGCLVAAFQNSNLHVLLRCSATERVIIYSFVNALPSQLRRQPWTSNTWHWHVYEYQPNTRNAFIVLCGVCRWTDHSLVVFRLRALKPNSIMLSWSQTGPRLVADLLARARSCSLAASELDDMPNSSSLQVCGRLRTCLRPG